MDGNINTKWCTNWSPIYIEFHSSGLIVPTGYILTTANDAETYNRHWSSWTIKAKANESDEWTTLASVNDNKLPAKNLVPVEFTISGNTTAYKYFRIDVFAAEGLTRQLAEFQFKGTTTDTDNITIKPSLSGDGTLESP